MKPQRLLLLLALLCASCSDPREQAVKILDSRTAAQLRFDAALVYKETFSGHSADFVLVRSKLWPASFHAFTPIRVGVYPDGVSLALKARNNSESGLYVVPRTMEVEPGSARGGRFERLAEGIYWYSFGN